MGIADALDTNTDTRCTVSSGVVQNGIVAGGGAGNENFQACNRARLPCAQSFTSKPKS